MSLFDDIHTITNEHVKDRQSAHRYLETVCAEMDALGRDIQAVRHIEEDFAHQQIDQLFDTDPGQRGPLHAVPLAHKELYGRKPETGAGWLYEGGSASCQGERAIETAHVIKKLDAAGAVDCARTVSVEYALGVTGHNNYAGTPLNPWNHDYIRGGSSSGSGAVVAAGIVPVSLGSDTGGSIRLPAAACGLIGIKPTHGLVSRSGVFPLSVSLDTVGPLSRTVRDSAMLLTQIAGYDSEDPLSIKVPKIDYLSYLNRPVDGIRLGLETKYFLSGTDSDIADLISAAFEETEAFGARLSEAQIADIDTTNPLNVLMISSEACHVHIDRLVERHNEMNPQTVMRVLTGLSSTQEIEDRLAATRAGLAARIIEDIFADIDVFVTPVWPFALPTIADSDVGAKPEAAALMQHIGHNTRPVNFLGLPAIVVPIGFDKNGLPVSMQLVGKPYSEGVLIALARQCEKHFSFWDNRPPTG